MEINGVAFITSKEAAKQAGYSADYISKLARDRKIVGTQIDRQWFIDPSSLERFLDSARLEKEARKKRLQEERSLERTLKSQSKVHQNTVAHKADRGTMEAVVKAGIVMLVGTLIGTSALNLYSGLVETSAQDNVAQVTAPQYAAPETETKQVPTTEYLEPSNAAVNFSDGVLLLRPGSEDSLVEQVRSMFSDPVTVEFKDDRIGVVKLQEDGTEVEYPVVIVPNN